HQLDTFYNALNPADQDSLNSAAGGNLLERHSQTYSCSKSANKCCDYRHDRYSQINLSNPTPISDPIVSSSPTLTSLEESDLIWEEFEAYLASDSFPLGSDDTDFDPEGDLHLIEELLNNDPSSPLPLSHNPLSGCTTSSSPDHLLEEFTDELALITFPSGNDDLPFDIESDLKEIEYLLNHDPTKKMDSILND
ncbi:hypothetical protein Tco_1065218, partial [Tanacetum coccineum]